MFTMTYLQCNFVYRVIDFLPATCDLLKALIFYFNLKKNNNETHRTLAEACGDA